MITPVTLTPLILLIDIFFRKSFKLALIKKAYGLSIILLNFLKEPLPEVIK